MALRKIVVFGAMGTIGSAIVAALSPGYEIIPVSRRTSKYKADLTDIATLRARRGPGGAARHSRKRRLATLGQ